MANNCLVTRLKGTVNNADIPFLGQVTIKVNSLSSPNVFTQQLRMKLTSPGKAVVMDGSASINVGSNDVIPSEYLSSVDLSTGFNTLYFKNGNYKVALMSKYSMVYLGYANTSGYNRDMEVAYQVNLSDLNYMNDADGLIDLAFAGNHGAYGIFSPKFDVSKLQTLTICPNNNVVKDFGIDLDALSGAKNLKGIWASGATKTKGNIENLISSTKMLYLFIYGSNERYYGDIISLAEGQVAAGRTSDTLNIQAFDGDLTINGEPFNKAYIESQGGTTTLFIDFGSSYDGGYRLRYQ